jgi:hypothetical protein
MRTKHKMILLFLALPLLGLAQTWYKVASESPSASVALPAGTVYRWGIDPTGCPTGFTCDWLAPVITTQAGGLIPYYTSFASDPAYGVVKELDVLEAAAPQTVVVTDSGVATTVTVPASPPQMANPFTVCSAPCTVDFALMNGPLILQTGSGEVWDAPFVFTSLPVTWSAGEIDAEESIAPFDITVTDSAGTRVVHVPAAPDGASNPAITLANL